MDVKACSNTTVSRAVCPFTHIHMAGVCDDLSHILGILLDPAPTPTPSTPPRQLPTRSLQPHLDILYTILASGGIQSKNLERPGPHHCSLAPRERDDVALNAHT